MRHHGNYLRKKGKRAGRKPIWYVYLAKIRNDISKALNAFDNRKRK